VHAYSFPHIARTYVCLHYACFLLHTHCTCTCFWCVGYPSDGSAHLFMFQAGVTSTLHSASLTHWCSLHFVCHGPLSCTYIWVRPFSTVGAVSFVAGFISPYVPFLDPVIVSPTKPPYPTLSVPHGFVLSADLALYLPFQELVLVLVHSLTGSSNVLYLVIHYLGGLLLLCAAPGRIRSVRLHIYVCLPARGRDCGRDLLACRLASGLLLAAYVSSAHVQVWHSFQLFQAACCVCGFHG